jgi:NADH:ubiquinone oxidoreductase subunit 6 (subunit J)
MEITPITIAFFIMAAFALGGSLGVVVNRNLFHAALYLMLALFGVAGLFVLLEAPFLAAVQVLIYVGAITVLITITIMVTRRIMGVSESTNRQWPLAAGVSALIAITLGFVVLDRFAGKTPVAGVPADNILQLGKALADYQGYLVPFEVASVLLLAAMIGAIVVARE